MGFGFIPGIDFSSKSSSDSSQKVQSESTSNTANVGYAHQVISGKEVQFSNTISPEVVQLTKTFIEGATDVSKDFIGNTLLTANQAITAVKDRVEGSENPALSLSSRLAPVLVIAIISASIIYIFKRK